jgi:deoxycytidylate deaminase
MGKEVVPIDWLLPYFKIAAKTAEESPCVRRKYGAVVAYAGSDIRFIPATNARVAKCCDGACMRTRLSLMNGERTEVGAEVHAEIAALIRAGEYEDGAYFILVGFDNRGKELYGKNVYPCHACALAIKFAGYDHVYIRTSATEIRAVSTSKILQDRETEWEPVANL